MPPSAPPAAPPVEWLTLAGCAAEVQVGVEVVRGWCVAYENGDPSGLPSTHFGEKPDDPDRPADQRPKRLNRRVSVEDWRAFKLARQRRDAAEDRRRARETQSVLQVVPFGYFERRQARVAAGGRGRDQSRLSNAR